MSSLCFCRILVCSFIQQLKSAKVAVSLQSMSLSESHMCLGWQSGVTNKCKDVRYYPHFKDQSFLCFLLVCGVGLGGMGGQCKIAHCLLERRWRQQTAAHAPDTRQVCRDFAKTDFLEFCKSFSYVLVYRRSVYIHVD